MFLDSQLVLLLYRLQFFKELDHGKVNLTLNNEA